MIEIEFQNHKEHSLFYTHEYNGKEYKIVSLCSYDFTSQSGKLIESNLTLSCIESSKYEVKDNKVIRTTEFIYFLPKEKEGIIFIIEDKDNVNLLKMGRKDFITDCKVKGNNFDYICFLYENRK